MGFQPLHDRVLVKRLEEQDKTPGGVIIPDTAKEKPTEARYRRWPRCSWQGRHNIADVGSSR